MERLQLIDAQLFSKYTVQDGILISRSWRALLKEDVDLDTFTYSEVDLMAFAALMQNLREYDISFDDTATFVDVGSGLGKLIIASTVLGMFKKSIGIEIVGSLHRKAVEVLATFSRNFRNPLDQGEMEFINGDGTYVDWAYASLIFVHATNFDVHMMQRITSTAQRMLLDAVIMIVNNRLLEEHNFELVRIVDLKVSYGTAQVFIYRKMLRGGSVKDMASARLKQVLRKTYDVPDTIASEEVVS